MAEEMLDHLPTLKRQRAQYTPAKKLKVVRYAKQYSIHTASHAFDIDRKTIRLWKKELRTELPSMQTKLEAVQYAERHSIGDAAFEFNVDRKTIREWCRDRDEMSNFLKPDPMDTDDDGSRQNPLIRVRRNTQLSHYLDRFTLLDLVGQSNKFQIQIGCLNNGLYEYVASVDSVMLAVMSPVLHEAMDSLAGSEDQTIVFEDADSATVLKTLRLLIESSVAFVETERDLIDNVIKLLESLGIEKEDLKVVDATDPGVAAPEAKSSASFEYSFDPFEYQGLLNVEEELPEKPNERTEYRCAETGCDYQTSKPAYWYKHKKRHDGSRNTKLCPDCGKEFHDLYTHQRYFHKRDTLPVMICPYDGCRYRTHIPQNFNKHKKRHEPPTIPCPYCSMLFHIKGDIKRHIATSHTDDADKKYQCEVCGKA